MVRLIVEVLLVVAGAVGGMVLENKYGFIAEVKAYWASHFGKPAGS